MSGQSFLVMGVVNVTPDSFSDGGLYFEPEAAVARGLELEQQGAGILDIGGESTRPGAAPVSAAEERRRVIPVIEGLRAAGARARISVDTAKASVAAAALEAGASIVNDVTALRGDAAMAGLVSDAGAELCLMHMQGDPRTMQQNPTYGDVVADVKAFLARRLEMAVAAGVAPERIMLDPGIGFGKTAEHNLELLRRLDELLELGRPLLIGTSRKSFLGRITQREVEDRLPATIATNVVALAHGASIFRVHDVRAIHDALKVAAATVSPRCRPGIQTITTTT